MPKPTNRLFVPNVGVGDLLSLRDTFSRKWLGLGPVVEEVEKHITQISGIKYAIGTNSATSGLHLAVKSLNLPPNSKVILPSLTFASTALSVLYCGHEVVFADVCEKDLQIDPDKLADLLDKTGASCVIGVHYGGHRMNMQKLREICNKHNSYLIEDCAHTLPYNEGIEKQYEVGTYSDICVYSFEEKKILSIGDGGMVCTNNENIASDIRKSRWLGIDKSTWSRTALGKKDSSWFYTIETMGYKYNMNDISASILKGQLKKLKKNIKTRKKIINTYLEHLNLNKYDLLLPYNDSNNVYHIFGIRTNRRDELAKHLREKEIAHGVHYTPLHMQPLFKGNSNSKTLKTTEKLYEQMITLPLHHELRSHHVKMICREINEFHENQ